MKLGFDVDSQQLIGSFTTVCHTQLHVCMCGRGITPMNSFVLGNTLHSPYRRMSLFRNVKDSSNSADDILGHFSYCVYYLDTRATCDISCFISTHDLYGDHLVRTFE